MGAGRKSLSLCVCACVHDTDLDSEWAQRVGQADALIRKST